MSSPQKDGSQFWDTDGPELLDELTEATHILREQQARQLELVARMGRSQVHDAAGYSSLPAFLMQTQRISLREARLWVSRAEQITESLTPTGHVTPAPLPAAREAVLEGAIGGDHLDVIAKAMDALPAAVAVADRAVVEQSLTDYARSAPPNAVHKLGEALVGRLDPDGQQPHAKEAAAPKNLLRLHRYGNGRMKVTADIDKEAAEEFHSMLKHLGALQGAEDFRHQVERFGDAFTEVIHLAAKARSVAKASVLVALDYDMLQSEVGTATLAESGTVFSVEAARRIACDADILPVVLNGKSVPLDLGRKHRCINTKQRTALIARDRGCAFPDCPREPRWCDGHHVQHWSQGGDTDVHNLVLLCRRHHMLVHHSEWDVRMSAGLPEFVPPRWIDPARAPRRNRLHLPRE